MSTGFQNPNGRTLFTDATGKPLVGGTVTNYIPNTSSPKDTYQDPGLTTPNTNPVVLDGSGTAVMWGSGLYRQVVKDVLGNTISDSQVGFVFTSGDSSTPITVASAATVDLGSLVENVIITGNVNITSFGSSGVVGQHSRLQFTGTLNLIYSSPGLVLPNNLQNLPINPGDIVEAICTGTGHWTVFDYSPAKVTSVTLNPANNSPYLPYDYSLGGDPGSNYPDAAMMGRYSAPHFQVKSLITAQPGNSATVWAYSQGGTVTAPVTWGIDYPGLQVLCWPMDNTGAYQADTSVAGGRSQFQGRSSQIEWWQGATQTQTSRPGALTFDTTRVGYQAPTTQMWISSRGGVVMQGNAVPDAIASTLISYPWNSPTNQSAYAPVPNINSFDYTDDSNLTLIMSDTGSNGVMAWYRGDALGASNQKTGFLWDYIYSTSILRLSAINNSSATGALWVGSDGTLYPQQKTLMGSTSVIASEACVLQSTGTNRTAAAFNRVSSTGNLINFYQAGTGVGSIAVTGSTTAFNTSSDYRLKTDLKDIDVSLFDKLKVYDFKWKKEATRSLGVLAHELSEVIPEAVNGDKDALDENGNIVPQGVDYSKLVPLLIAKIQQQQLAIQQQESRISALEKGK